MKIKFLITLLTVSQIIFGQTENHKIIAGTKYSLIPPDEFEASTSFSGFQNNKLGASIMVTEIPGPVQAMVDGFTADALKSRGMTLIDKQTIDFNNSKATLFKVIQQANGVNYCKQILVFGDSKKTVLVNGIYPEANKKIENEIKKSLLSTSYNEDQKDDPLDAVNFKIDVTGTEFKLAKYVSGSLLFTTDGQIPTEKPSLIVGSSISKVSPDNQKQYCIDRLKKLPRGELNKPKEINPILIDNLKGYEIIADGKDKNSKDQLVYQVILFSESGDYYIIVGTANTERENNLKSFQKIAATFTLK